MDSISYKGYLGTVNFSEKDEAFFGKIEGFVGSSLSMGLLDELSEICFGWLYFYVFS